MHIWAARGAAEAGCGGARDLRTIREAEISVGPGRGSGGRGRIGEKQTRWPKVAGGCNPSSPSGAHLEEALLGFPKPLGPAPVGV